MLRIICSALLFCAFACRILAMVAPSSQGHKYDLELQKVLPVNDTTYVVFKDLKVKRYNKTFYAANGTFDIEVDFDDEYIVEAYCWRSKLGNNQWELTSFKTPPQKVSEFLRKIYIPHIQPDVTPYSNLPAFEDADADNVFPAGTYKIENYIGDIQNFPPHLQDGVYRIEIFISKDKIVVSGFIIWWKVYPEVG